MESVGGVGRTTAVTLPINEANPIEGSANHEHLKTNMKYIFIEYLSLANRTRRIEHPKLLGLYGVGPFRQTTPPRRTSNR